MAQYDYLPIYKKAFDLALYFEKRVKNFSRYTVFSGGTAHWSSTSCPSYPIYAYHLDSYGDVGVNGKAIVNAGARCVRFEE